MPVTCSSYRGHSMEGDARARGGVRAVVREGVDVWRGPVPHVYISQANTKSVKPSQAKPMEPSGVGDFDPSRPF